MMEKYFDYIKAGMANALSFDSAVRPDLFSSEFSGSDFIDFVFSNLLMLLVQQKDNCDFLATIPLTQNVESLNASVAAGIMMYEVVRNRK